MSDKPMMPVDFERLSPEEMIVRSHSHKDEMVHRRSVRDFDSQPVPLEVIDNAIITAGSAPSGANLQPWHFVVVTSAEMKHRIREAAEEIERGFYERRITEEWRGALAHLDVDTAKPFLEEAAALIVVFRRNHVVDETGESHKTYYPMESAGIATGLLISALHLSGVASLPYTPSPMGFLREMLGRPESDVPFLVLAVGYPKKDAVVPDLKKEPLERIATFI